MWTGYLNWERVKGRTTNGQKQSKDKDHLQNVLMRVGTVRRCVEDGATPQSKSTCMPSELRGAINVPSLGGTKPRL